MKNYYLGTVLVFACALLLIPGIALAGTHPRSANIDVLYPSKIGNHAELKPGTYRVELMNNTQPAEVMFYQQGKLVAKAPAKLINQNGKISQTEVYYSESSGQHVITQLDLRGWNKRVDFQGSTNTQKGS